jgi:hypothetical protein
MARRKLHYIADGQTVQGSATPAAIAADGAYPITAWRDEAAGFIQWEGGEGAFILAGTLGGGTYTLQIQAPDGTSWVSVGSAAALTAAGAVGFTAPSGRLRVSVSGSAAAAAKAWVVGIPTNNGG